MGGTSSPALGVSPRSPVCENLQPHEDSVTG